MTREELIAALEKATGPSWELDGEIADTLGLHMPDDNTIKPWEWPPRYTASLDAALTLVPTDPVRGLRLGQWWWMIEAWPGEVRASVHYENGDAGILEEEGKHATPAIALCIAALRARAGGEG